MPPGPAIDVFGFWTRGWRRRGIASRIPPAEWSQILDRHLASWQSLDRARQSRLLSLVAIFLAEKEVVVPPEIPDAVQARVTVAAAAGLMLLGFNDWYCFDRVETVILTPGLFPQRLRHAHIGGLVNEVAASGVYVKGAPVSLSWPEVQQDCAGRHPGHNVVIHEFAHHIDDLDGVLDGTPPFATTAQADTWRRLVEMETRRLENHLDRGESTVLDPYALEGVTEFFAVSCEAFFCKPRALAAAHARLFGLLATLFRIDPRTWRPPDAPQVNDSHRLPS